MSPTAGATEADQKENTVAVEGMISFKTPGIHGLFLLLGLAKTPCNIAVRRVAGTCRRDFPCLGFH